jgi:phosphoglycolate phosphatase
MNFAVSRTWSAVLFDLDGTIIDSGPGILEALVKTFEHLGLPVPSTEDLMSFIGPPLKTSFETYAGFSPEKAAEAVAIYRNDYRGDGGLKAPVFPGILGLLESLHDAGIPLGLATSKPEDQAIKILEAHNLTHFFTVISGASDEGGRLSKADVVAHATSELSRRGVDTSSVVLVGDRIHDVEGAAEHGIPTIMVEWGYGSPQEAHGAIATVYSADRLRELLLGN